jgi:serine/threonine protein kinase
MPPEQFGGRTVPASDLYSLGATLIYLITRTHPADSPLKDGQIQFDQVNNISPYFINWLQQMTQPSLDKRFTSASQALESLQEPEAKFVPSQKDDSLPTGRQPDGSRIKLTKNKNYLDIYIPTDGFVVLLSLILLLGISGMPFVLITFFTGSLKIFNIFLIIFFFSLPVLAVVSNPSSWMYNILHINQQQIISISRLWRLKIINYSAPRQDIVKLVYIQQYTKREYRSHGKKSRGYWVDVKVPAQLIIWAGVRQFKLSGSNEKMEWLGQELSNWLGLPITRV